MPFIKFTFFLVSLLALSLPTSLRAEEPATSGLVPFKPPKGTNVSRELRASPSDDALLLREVTTRDKVNFLRTFGPWYEVDLTTEEGISFRGWLKGELAVERQSVQPTAPLERKALEDPLKSDRYLWFWSGKIGDKGSIGFEASGQKIDYKLTGLQSGTRNTIYKYNFTGFSLGTSFDYALLQTPVFNHSLFWVIEGSYHFAFYRLSFSSGFQIPEVRGAGYQINTHTYHFRSLAKYRLYSSESAYFQVGAGFGFFMHDVSPDLDPVHGGSYDGTLIFVETTTQGLSVPIRIDGRFAENYFYSLSATPILLASVSEERAQFPSLDSDGIPLLFSGSFGYRFSQKWSTNLHAEMFSAKGKGSGAGTRRIDQDYSDGAIQFGYMRAGFDLRYHF